MAIANTKVKVKHPQGYGYDLASKFGVDKDLLQKAKLTGVTIVGGVGGGIRILLAGKVQGVVPIKPQVLTLLNNGTLGNASKDAVKYQFELILKKSIDPMVAGIPTNSSGEPYFEVKESFQEKPAVESEEVATLMNNDPCNLIDAKELYQKVKSTSVGSVYEVIALLKGAAVAARVKPNQLSLRVEGEKLGDYIVGLESVGLSNKGGYCSGHFSISSSDIGLLKKTIGALIGSCGFDNVVIAGDISKVGGA